MASFTIKDLEALSGIKAHTIRVWEKRYDLLNPVRSDTNIRSYSVKCLQKLLSVSLLNSSGLKISKIVKLSDVEIVARVKELSLNSYANEQAINTLTISMFTFDKKLFNTIYNNLLNSMSYRNLVSDVLFPFLQHLGFLWQTDVIKPVHEHFIANLIINKIHLNTEKIDYSQDESAATYVLFLPQEEVHQIALLYLNYELVLKGYKTIYLGQNLPLDNLVEFVDNNNTVHFVSCLTIRPYEDEILTFFDEVSELLKNSQSTFIAFGDKVSVLKSTFKNEQIKLYTTINELLVSV